MCKLVNIVCVKTHVFFSVHILITSCAIFPLSTGRMKRGSTIGKILFSEEEKTVDTDSMQMPKVIRGFILSSNVGDNGVIVLEKCNFSCY